LIVFLPAGMRAVGAHSGTNVPRVKQDGMDGLLPPCKREDRPVASAHRDLAFRARFATTSFGGDRLTRCTPGCPGPRRREHWHSRRRDPWALGPWLLAALLFARGWVHLLGQELA
jgi:hypothetical protein